MTPEEYPLMMLPGYKYLTPLATKNTVQKNEQNLTTIQFYVSKSDDSLFTNGIHRFAELPLGYAPSKNVHLTMGATDTSSPFKSTSFAHIEANSRQIFAHIAQSNVKIIAGNISYYANV